MPTSNTATFDLDFAELAEEAFERAGREMRSGYDLRTARRSMNLLTVEWANRGINMWTIEEGSIPLVQGTATYTLPADTIDLMDHVIRTGAGSASTQADIAISRISSSDYSAIPNKLSQARPVQIWIQRLRDAPQVTLWPVPNLSSTYTLIYWRLRRIQDAGAGGTFTQDMPFRFLGAAAAGLAYYLAMKNPEMAERVPMLQAEYERQWDLASGEDREKATLRIVPRRSFIGGRA